MIKGARTLVLLGFMCISLVVYALFSKEKKSICSEVELIFMNTLFYDLENRLSYSGEYYSFSSDIYNSDHLVVQSEDSVSLLNKRKDSKVSLVARQSNAIQTVLLEEGYPIIPQIVDSIFARELHFENYYFETAIRYTDDTIDKMVESKLGSIVYNCQSTKVLRLGLYDEISIQGFYKIPLSAVFHRAPVLFILLFIAWLITIVVFTVLTLRKKPVEGIAYVPVSDISKPLDSNPLIQINAEKGIYFDPATSILYYGKNQHTTLANQPATFLLALLEALDHFLTYEQVNQLFWPKLEDTRNVRNQAANRLREELSPVEALKLETVNRNGYKLVVLP